MNNNRVKFHFLLLTSCFLLVALLTYILLPPKTPFSPFSSISPTISPPNNQPYTILGFAPYWNRKKISQPSLNGITDLAYFALLLDSDGSIYTHVNSREQEPGYTNYQRLLANSPYCAVFDDNSDEELTPSTIDQPCPALTLTFMPESQNALQSILNSKTNRTKAVNTIASRLKEASASGVNVDFEPLGSTPPSLRNNFTLFIKELKSRTSTIYDLPPTISISIYPSAASRLRIWDLTALNEYTDAFVVMTYDYTLPGSDITGPNSPLRGAGQLFEHDIIKNLAEITTHIPSRKILLGIPFYGYEWDVDSSEKYAITDSRASVASIERIEDMIQEKTLELLWDRNSLTPYAVRREDGEIVSQIYYENSDSIRLKLELVKQAELGGIAIWALGYEGENTALGNSIWQVINTLNTP